MIKALIILTLIFPINAFSVDYYIYKGSRIELEERPEKIALMLSNDFDENYIKNKIGMLIEINDEIITTSTQACIINFSREKSHEEMNAIIDRLKREVGMIKFVTKVYYGTSKDVTQIPTDRFIVRLKNSKDKEKLDIYNIENSCLIDGRIGDGKSFIIKTNSSVSKNSLEMSAIYLSKGIFEFAEPDFLYPDKCLLQSVPNDQYFPSQWALKNTGQMLQTGSTFITFGDLPAVNGIPNADMNVTEAWEITTGSPAVKVGVIDSGIDSLHPDLQAVNHLLPGYNAYLDINSSPVDILNHGTSTAGLIGAVMNNSIGISGIAPGCKLMAINIFDNKGSTLATVIARAFDTARVRGIDVISCSWGGMTPLEIITDAINNAAIYGREGLGSVILFASGNDGRNPPIYPSILPNVISVGGSTPHDQKKSPGTGNQFYWGSNYGEDASGDLDIIAPSNCYTLKSGGYEQNFWGTSATCPNASGVAALILSVNATQTRLQVFENLFRGCDKIDNTGYSKNKAFGKWNDYYGYGRVNALNSVNLALGTDVTPPVINHANVSSHSSTYPTLIKAEIIDQDGAGVPSTGINRPKLFYKINKNGAGWTSFNTINAESHIGNEYTFKIPSQGWETEVQYYIRARDNSGNETTFPKHAPDSFWLSYYAIGNIISDSKKINSFLGVNNGGTLSPTVTFGDFKVLGARVKINLRHFNLNDEIIQIFSPEADANNNRKCLFSANGGELDHITGASVSDSASLYWSEGTPPYLNGYFKPDYILNGLNGHSASGNWRILHFDRAIGNNANFDSVRITLYKTSGVASSSARLDSPEDSTLNFGTVYFPEVYERDFYLKNSGTANLLVSDASFTGDFADMFTLLDQPSSAIIPNDSGLFKVRLDTREARNAGISITGAILQIQTNDPSKNIFRVSLLTDDSLHFGMKMLRLTTLIEGMYEPLNDSMVADTVNVFLRNASSPYVIIDSSKEVTNSEGFAEYIFTNLSSDSGYYIVVKQRNSVETWSAGSINFDLYSKDYDFTEDRSQAYGNNLSLKGGKYCIFSGEVNYDGVIDAVDLSLVDNSAANFITGNRIEDLNGDRVVDARDLAITDNNVFNFISVRRP